MKNQDIFVKEVVERTGVSEPHADAIWYGLSDYGKAHPKESADTVVAIILSHRTL